MHSYRLLRKFSNGFFFSSRRRHTRYWRDWSSDVWLFRSEKLAIRKPKGLHHASDRREPISIGRTDFAQQRCPVARSMAVLGERWAILILREAFYGATRFDEFQRNLGIAPNILSARLRALVAHGVLERAPGAGGGARHEYRLTEKGRDVFPAYLALKRWGDRWMAPPEGPVVRSEEHTSELQSRQYLACRLLLEKKKKT